MTTRNFDALFDPKAIALIGASNQPNSVGRVLARNLLGGGFLGPVMTVNPHARSILSTLNYNSIDALPIVPDLAVVATPAATVPGIIADLGRRGCRAAVVISAGLGEGGSGRTLRQQMLDAARPHLLRIVGPNCLGFISPRKGVNASFANTMPRAGNVALVSQSGAIVAALLDWADARGIGFSQVVSLGDMADADFGDLLDYLSMDASTSSILLYVENVTHAKKFMSAARIAARSKPVLVVKSGRSAGGAKAALSHTGALAGSDAVYDAAFRRAGVLRVAELDELFEAAATLGAGIRPGGDRLVILTNGGGAGILATDALEARGGRLAALDAGTVAALGEVLPAAASRANPVDIIGDAPAERYTAALDILTRKPEGDAVLVINCPTAVADSATAARAVIEAAARRPMFPVLTNWLGGTAAAPARALFSEAKIPTFASPEAGVRAFMHLVNYRRNQELLLETPAAGVQIRQERTAQAQSLVAAALAEGRSVLSEPESKELLRLFDIPTVETRIAHTPEEASRLFTEIGAPAAVVKILSHDISHKSDVGGVCLNLTSAAQVEDAAREMLKTIAARLPQARLLGLTVQPMIRRPAAEELIAGIAADATFGPVILFGRGGKATEIIGDRTIGLPPLNSVLARDMIERTAVAKLLDGYRDVPAVAKDKIAEVLVRLSELLIAVPEMCELDINPLLADAAGLVALDARVVVRKVAPGAARLSIRPYPAELEQEAVLPGGERFLLRPIRPEDETELSALVARCTPQDLRLRFFGPLKEFQHQMAARLSQIDYDREMAIIATAPGSQYGAGRISGVVRLISDPENEAAEFAVLVQSDLKGRGLGYRLMSEILDYAKRRGLKRVFGHVLGENTSMLRMARELGFQVEPSDSDANTVRVTIPVAAAWAGSAHADGIMPQTGKRS